MLKGDVAAVLRIVNELDNSGKDLRRLAGRTYQPFPQLARLHTA